MSSVKPLELRQEVDRIFYVGTILRVYSLDLRYPMQRDAGFLAFMEWSYIMY